MWGVESDSGTDSLLQQLENSSLSTEREKNSETEGNLVFLETNHMKTSSGSSRGRYRVSEGSKLEEVCKERIPGVYSLSPLAWIGAVLVTAGVLT